MKRSRDHGKVKGQCRKALSELEPEALSPCMARAWGSAIAKCVQNRHYLLVNDVKRISIITITIILAVIPLP